MGKPMIGVGSILWRGVSLNMQTGVKLIEYKPMRSPSGKEFVLRAIYGAGYCTKDPQDWIIGNHTRGLVCFCAEEIPADWTWFEVVEMSEDRTSAIVKPVVGDKKALLDRYVIKDFPVFRNSIQKILGETASPR